MLQAAGRRTTARRVGLILGMLGLVGSLTPVWAGDDDPDRVHRERVRIITVDDDGERHERSFEFSSDRPGAYLGVRLGETIETDVSGAQIVSVVEDSPAEQAGFEPGDVVVAFAGRPIASADEFFAEVVEAEPGESVEVEVLRDGVRRTLSVELATRPHHVRGFVPHVDVDIDLGESMEHLHERMAELHERLGEIHVEPHVAPHFEFRTRHGRPKLGVHLVGTTPELREHLGGPRDAGVLVSRVVPDSPAEEAGVLVGDLIVAVDDRPIEDAGDLIRELRPRSGEKIYVDVIRDGSPLTLQVYIREQETDSEPGPRA